MQSNTGYICTYEYIAFLIKKHKRITWLFDSLFVLIQLLDQNFFNSFTIIVTYTVHLASTTLRRKEKQIHERIAKKSVGIHFHSQLKSGSVIDRCIFIKV